MKPMIITRRMGRAGHRQQVAPPPGGPPPGAQPYRRRGGNRPGKPWLPCMVHCKEHHANPYRAAGVNGLLLLLLLGLLF
jgi:hypothetical protein